MDSEAVRAMDFGTARPSNSWASDGDDDEEEANDRGGGGVVAGGDDLARDEVAMGLRRGRGDQKAAGVFEFSAQLAHEVESRPSQNLIIVPPPVSPLTPLRAPSPSRSPEPVSFDGGSPKRNQETNATDMQSPSPLRLSRPAIAKVNTMHSPHHSNLDQLFERDQRTERNIAQKPRTRRGTYHQIQITNERETVPNTESCFVCVHLKKALSLRDKYLDPRPVPNWGGAGSFHIYGKAPLADDHGERSTALPQG